MPAVCAFLISYYWTWVREQVSSPLVPAIVMFIIGYMIGSIFMSIFSIGSNTILQCFIMDLEIAEVKHDGGADHQPQSLQGFVNEVEARYNKKQEKKMK